MSTRKATKEDETIAPNQSQPLGPRIGAMGRSEENGLKQTVWISFGASEGGSFSLVMKASILSCRRERPEALQEIGRRRSSIVRSADVLKAQIR